MQDLQGIVDYIAADSVDAADQFAESLATRLESLGGSPYRGQVCPFHKLVRQIIHGQYIIYYSVKKSEILVRAVVHGARLFQKDWLRRNENRS